MTFWLKYIHSVSSSLIKIKIMRVITLYVKDGTCHRCVYKFRGHPYPAHQWPPPFPIFKLLLRSLIPTEGDENNILFGNINCFTVFDLHVKILIEYLTGISKRTRSCSPFFGKWTHARSNYQSFNGIYVKQWQ